MLLRVARTLSAFGSEEGMEMDEADEDLFRFGMVSLVLGKNEERREWSGVEWIEKSEGVGCYI